MRALRRGMDPDLRRELSARIAQQLFRTREWEAADAVWCYLSLPEEVDTAGILGQAAAEGKHTAIPVIREGRMLFSGISAGPRLIPGAFGIPEPEEFRPACGERPLIVMPGIAYDTGLHRLGFGGGYYDRFLAEHPGFVTAAPAFDFSVLQEIPAEEHDIRPRVLITESRILRLP